MDPGFFPTISAVVFLETVFVIEAPFSDLPDGLTELTKLYPDNPIVQIIEIVSVSVLNSDILPLRGHQLIILREVWRFWFYFE